MEQTPKSKRLLVFEGCLYLVFRAWFKSGLFLIPALLIRYPLAIFVLSAAWTIGWTWKLLIILPLAILCSVLLASTALNRQMKQTIVELTDFYDEFQHCRFVPITLEEYLEAIYQSVPDETDSLRKPQPPVQEAMLSDIEYFFGGHLRFVVVDQEETLGPGLGMAVTFTFANRAWVFLNGHPRNMTGLQKFMVLHEVGHTDMLANLSYELKGIHTPLLWSLPIMAIGVQWGVPTFSLACILLVVALWANFSGKEMRKYIRIHDEMYADLFAFRRCRKEWFRDYPAAEIAKALCTIVQAPRARSESTTKVDSAITEEQKQLREKAFARNVDCVRKGQQATNDELLEFNPRFKNYRTFWLIQMFLILLLYVLLGLRHGQLTTIRFSALVVSILLVIVGYFFSVQAYRLSLNYWDKEFSSKKLSSNEEKELATFVRTRERMSRLKRIKQSQPWETLSDNTGEYVLADGTSSRLFLPAELDLRINKQTLEVNIYYGKFIDNDISHLFYVPTDHSVIVVMNDGKRFDLGVKLLPSFRSHFLKAKNVNIVRTEDRATLEEISVPLWSGVKPKR